MDREEEGKGEGQSKTQVSLLTCWESRIFLPDKVFQLLYQLRCGQYHKELKGVQLKKVLNGHCGDRRSICWPETHPYIS